MPRRCATPEPALADGLSAYRLAPAGRCRPPRRRGRSRRGRAPPAPSWSRASKPRRSWPTAARPASAPRLAAEPAGAVVVAAGPWTSALVDPPGGWRPIAPLVGRRTSSCGSPSRRATRSRRAASRTLLHAGGALDLLFSLVTRERPAPRSGRRSCPSSPTPVEVAPALVERGARFVPALGGTHVVSVRVLRAADERRRAPAARAAARR